MGVGKTSERPSSTEGHQFNVFSQVHYNLSLERAVACSWNKSEFPLPKIDQCQLQ